MEKTVMSAFLSCDFAGEEGREVDWRVPVKRAGKMRMTQMLVPFMDSVEEMPSRAISVEVSNPRPNRMPSGYIFHELPVVKVLSA
jgi:hypothetical protein